MPDQGAPRRALLAHRVALAAGLAVVAVAGVAAAGHAIGAAALTSVAPGLTPMRPNAALGLLALALASVLTVRDQLQGTRRRAGPALALAALAVMIGAITLYEYGAGTPNGIDSLLLPNAGGPQATARMSPLSAASLVLVGSGFLLGQKVRRLVVGFLLAAGGIAILALTAQVYGATLIAGTTQMAPHTALAILALAVAGMGSRPDLPPVSTLLSETTAGRLARRLVPIVIVVPLAVGYLRVVSDARQVLDVRGGIALFALAMVVVLLPALWLVVSRLASLEASTRRDAELLQVVAQHSPDAITVKDLQGRYLFLSHAAEAFVGHPSKEVVGTDMSHILSADTVAQLRAQDAEVIRLGAPVTREVRAQAGPNTTTFSILRTPYRDATGTIVGTIGISRDVTKQREVEERFARLFEANPVAMALSRADGTGVVDVNPAYERLTGYSRAEVLDPSFKPASLWADPSGRQMLLDQLARDGNATGVEVAIRRKDGARRLCRTNISSFVADGIRYFLSGLDDVTEITAARDALQRAQRRFQRVFDASPVGISLSTDAGRFVDANEAFQSLTGYTLEELRAPDMTAYAIWETGEARSTLVARLRQGVRVRNQQVVLRRKDGSRVQAEVSMDLVDVGGETLILSVVSDVTERLRIQTEREARVATEAELDRMRRTEEFRTQFINTTAHELATPLTPIMLQLHVLASGRPGPLTPDQQDALARIQRNVERLNVLVADIVQAARLQSGDMLLKRRALDLHEEAARAVAAHEEEAAAAGIGIHLEAGEHVTANADAERVQLVLGHLLGNALKFTPRGGHVTVRVLREPGYARLEVVDTGTGLEQEQIGKLFRPYGQAHDAMERTRGGVGLGLYVSKGIVELHGGHIGVHSGGTGHGSTFWFTLPRDG